MPIVVKHAKTSTVPAWTQTELDAAIAGKPAPIPAGTLIDGFATTQDWNDDHIITGLDTEYARLDGTNQPFTDAVEAPSFNGVALTTAGSATQYLNGEGNYTTPSGGGGGGGAPAGATYVTLTTNGSLTHERVLTAGTGISITDAGAGSTVTIAATSGSGAVDSVNGATGVVVLDTDDIADTATNRYTTDTDITRLANTSGTNTGDQNLYRTIAVSGQSDVVADSTTDTLTLVAGSNVTITTDATTDTITIASSGGGSSAFNDLTSGTNTTAAMVVGTGASLAATGSGTIVATSTTGNAATVTTNANLTGVVTSVGNATAIADAALSIAKTSGLQTALDGKQPLATVLTNTTAAFTTAQETKLAGIAAGAEVNAIDTVTDTAEIDLTITAKALSASIIAGSIDETKLDTSVNASLDLADSAVQPARSISTTAPLAGGGDLSANRTLTIADAAADGTTKGAATFTASDFNATAGLISIDYTNGQAASAGTKGFLTSADWTTFNSKGSGTVTSVSGTTNRITSSGGATPVIDIASTYVGQSSITTLGTITTGLWNSTAITDPYISSAATWNAKENALTFSAPLSRSVNTILIPAATTSVSGHLTSTDWNTFNGKQAALVSGTNIKTINSVSILGSGDLAIPALADGDKGDITVSGSGSTWTIDNLAVTNAKINDVAWSKVSSTPTTLSGYGISDAQPLDATLTAIAGLNTTAGVVVQTGADTFTKRTITGTASQVTVTNGNGAANNPTISLPTSLIDINGMSSQIIFDYGYDLYQSSLGFYDNSSNFNASYGLNQMSVTDSASSTYVRVSPDYVNFSDSVGSSGFGIRNNAGRVQYKDSGKDWFDIAGIKLGSYRVNAYHAGFLNTIITTNTATLVANRLYATPFVVTDAATFTRIGINVTSLSTGSARLGIYNFANGAPTTLVADLGTVSVTSTGEKEITISQFLSAGAYALCMICNGTPIVRRGGAGFAASFFGYPDSSTAVPTHMIQTKTFGALDASFGTPTYTNDFTTIPAIWLRRT